MLLILVILAASCGEKNNPLREKDSKNEESYLMDGENFVVRDVDGGVYTIKKNKNGFDFLYIEKNFQFSLHKKEEVYRYIVDIESGSDNSYSIVEVNGDWLPDYKIISAPYEKRKLSFKEETGSLEEEEGRRGVSP